MSARYLTRQRLRPTEFTRSPTDGRPYYCELCGLGWHEYVACEEADCKLESAATAQLRSRHMDPTKF